MEAGASTYQPSWPANLQVQHASSGGQQCSPTRGLEPKSRVAGIFILAVPRTTNCIVAVYSIVGGILGLFGKIDDEQQVLAEPGGAKTRDKLPFLCLRFDPEKA